MKKELGFVRITQDQQRQLNERLKAVEAGQVASATCNLSAVQWRATITKRAPQVGDVIWVQEPYTEFYSRRDRSRTKIVSGVGPLDTHGLIPSWWFALKSHDQGSKPHLTPTFMPRACSRLTFEVVEIVGQVRTGIRAKPQNETGLTLVCRVHAEQIDEFPKKRGGEGAPASQPDAPRSPAGKAEEVAA